jgi:DNA replication protein DnaC
VSVESLPNFTPPARQRWESIPTEIRQRLLSNVCSGHCRHETTITKFSGTIKRGNLLLVGACACAARLTPSTEGRLSRARLRQQACLEDVDTRTPRGLDRATLARLGTGTWLREHHNVLITGPAGVGKSYLACALAQQACRLGFSARYLRLPRLLEELAIARADGSYAKQLRRLAKIDVLVIDDWALAPLGVDGRRDLLEILDDRYQLRSTLVTSQLPVDQWHAYIGEATLADAILDRLIHASYRIALKGDSMRRKNAPNLTEPANPTR